MKILITGASGFVGSAAARAYDAKGWDVVAQSRQQGRTTPANPRIVHVTAELADPAPLAVHLIGTQAVLHTAARVHQVSDNASNPLQLYRQVNTEQTLALAYLAAKQGVRRFVFLSSVKVNGEWSAVGQPLTADGPTQPTDPYGISKCEAEVGLRAMALQTGMEVVIIRPPLIHGPGVKANFLTMMQWLQRGIPLPLGAINNQRSLVGLGNLVDLLEKCCTHPAAANQTFLASDGHDVSMTELLYALAYALKVKPRLIPVPQAVLQGALSLLGRKGMAQRLCGNLAVDIEKTRTLLDWAPPYTLAQGLEATAAHYLATRQP
jgi:nucleoside-diphosphate-sugar epimerase